MNVLNRLSFSMNEPNPVILFNVLIFKNLETIEP